MIKKSIIALAVASSALTGIAQADGTTLYGSVRVAYDYVSKKHTVSGEKIYSQSKSKIANKGTRLGVKGSNDLGDGLSAGYKIELKDSPIYYVNLNSSLGTLQAGRFTLPYNDIVTYSDLFNGAGGGYLIRGAVIDKIYDTGSLDFNTLAYMSPDLSGFKFTAGIVADRDGVVNREELYKGVVLTSSPDADHVDAYQLTAAYENSGFYAGLGWLRINTKVFNQNITGLSLGYENDTFKVGLSVENYKNNLPNRKGQAFYALAGSFNFNEANKIYASYGTFSNMRVNNTNIKSKANSYGIGYQHNLSDNTRLWVEYGSLDLSAKEIKVKTKTDKISLGLRTDF